MLPSTLSCRIFTMVRMMSRPLSVSSAMISAAALRSFLESETLVAPDILVVKAFLRRNVTATPRQDLVGRPWRLLWRP